MSGKCISLAGSKTCPAFNESSISTDSSLVAQFPFLAYVSDLEDFDAQLSNYVKGEYVKLKYQQLLGCSDVDLSNTSSLYARYTTSVICNGIVQNSKEPCGLSDDQARPLCADACALSATSEEEIAVNPKLCGKPKSDFMSQIRADFTVCSLPADSLTGTCISGSDNEPDECGFGTNLLGLCTYCASSSPNATDSCCVNSNAAGRCENVKLPTTPTTLPPLFPTSSSNSSATGAAASHGGLSGGQIAGIVIGSVAGFGALLALGVLLLICLRRRRDQHARNILNQPTPQRKGSPPMQYTRTTNSQQGIEVTPGGRVARMSALQTSSSHSPPRSRASAARTKYSDSSDSETFGASPGSVSRRAPPVTSKRKASLSSHSMLGGETPRSGTAGQVSSPEGVASTLSEQLPFFRDYYSEDDIHPGDKVSVLWAYQPRAADEFELNRGEMLKVIAIWDDGWATGVRVPERAEDYDWRRRVQRDSGVSNGSERRGSSPQPTGEIKAFPLVCVCLPQHWRKTIEGEMQIEGGSGDPPP